MNAGTFSTTDCTDSTDLEEEIYRVSDILFFRADLAVVTAKPVAFRPL
jgi:hypothetical protein